MADTAFHRMANQFNQFNQGLNNTVGEIKQRISPEVDMTAIDQALTTINNKFQQVSGQGPEELRKAVQEVTSEVNGLLSALESLKNSNGLSDMGDDIDKLKQGFENISQSVGTFNNQLEPVKRNVNEIVVFVEEVNRGFNQTSTLMDQWAASARMVNEDFKKIDATIQNAQTHAMEMSKAIFDMDSSKVNQTVADSLYQATSNLTDTLGQINKAREGLKNDLEQVANGNTEHVEKLTDNLDKFFKLLKASGEHFGSLKTQIQSSGLSEFDDLLEKITSHMLGVTNNIEKAFGDAPAQVLRDYAKELKAIVSVHEELVQKANSSRELPDLFGDIINGKDLSGNGTEFYLKMLGKGVEDLSSIVKLNGSDITKLMQDIQNLSGNSSQLGDFANVKNYLVEMDSSYKQLLAIHKEARDIFSNENSNEAQKGDAISRLIKAESDALQMNRNALEQAIESFNSPNLMDNIAGYKFISDMQSQADALGVSMKSLALNMAEIANENGFEDQAAKFKKFADEVEEHSKYLSEGATGQLNKLLSLSVGESDPFRDEVMLSGQRGQFIQGGRRHGSALNKARDIESMAHDMSVKEEYGMYLADWTGNNKAPVDPAQVADKARELQVVLSKIEKTQSAVDQAFKDGDSDTVKELMSGLIEQQQQAAGAGLDLRRLFGMSQKDIDKLPEDMRQDFAQMFKKVQDMMKDVVSSTDNTIAMGKMFDDTEVDEMTESLKLLKAEMMDYQNQAAGNTGFFGTKRGGLMGGKSIGDVVKGGFMKTRGMSVAGLGMMGLGALPVTANGLMNFASGTFSEYQKQGRMAADMALAQMAYGNGFGENEFAGIMDRGRELNLATNGLIGTDDLALGYTSISRNLIGQYGGDKLSDAETQSLTEKSLLMQKGLGASQGSIDNAMNTYYKELGMTVGETEYQFAKLIQTSQALNIPFDKHLNQVVDLAKQYRTMGIGADAAGNAINNLISGGMSAEIAQQFAQSYGKGITSMDSGSLAFGGMASGLYNDPFTAIGDLKYGLWDKNGNVKEDKLQNLVAINDTMLAMYSGIAGGHEGAQRMILGDRFKSQGMTDMQAGMAVEMYMEDPNSLGNIFKDFQSGNLGPGDPTQQAFKDLEGVIGTASDQLSGTDKTLNMLNNTMSELATKNKNLFDGLTDYTAEITLLKDAIQATPMDEIVKKMNSLGGAMDFLSGALLAAAIGGPALLGVGKLYDKVRGSKSSRNRGSSDSDGKGSSSKTTNHPDSDSRKSNNDVESWEEDDTHNKNSSKKTKAPKMKGRGGAIIGILTALGVGSTLFDGSGVEAADVLGTEGLSGLASGKGGATLDDVHADLLAIYQVLSGGSISTATGTGSVPTSTSVTSKAQETAEYLAGNSYTDRAATDSALNAVYMGATATWGLSQLDRIKPSAPGLDLERRSGWLGGIDDATNAGKGVLNKVGKGAKVASKAIAPIAVAAGAADIGFGTYDDYKLNEMAGIKGDTWLDALDNVIEFASFGFDWPSSLVGLGDESRKNQKIKKSAEYRAAMDFKTRFEKQYEVTIDDMFALVASNAMKDNASTISTMSQTDKDIWGATYAKYMSQGKTEKEALAAANELTKPVSVNDEDRIRKIMKANKDIDSKDYDSTLEGYVINKSQLSSFSEGDLSKWLEYYSIADGIKGMNASDYAFKHVLEESAEAQTKINKELHEEDLKMKAEYYRDFKNATSAQERANRELLTNSQTNIAELTSLKSVMEKATTSGIFGAYPGIGGFGGYGPGTMGMKTPAPFAGSAESDVANYYLNPANFNVTSKFGVDRGDHKHAGVDLQGSTKGGEAVLALKGGEVTAAGSHGTMGNYVFVKNGDDIFKYMHMVEKPEFKVGDYVETGSTLGHIGNTGRSTGPHLHLGISRGDIDMDPYTYMQGMAGSGNTSAYSSTGKYDGVGTYNGAYANEINAAAQKYGVDPALIASIIKAESGFVNGKTSTAGAQGLMQLMPDTAKGLGVNDVMDPYQNIMGGTKYISQMLDKYNGDVRMALAAYNWGPGNVDKKGISPEALPEETESYLSKVIGAYESGGFHVFAGAGTGKGSSYMNLASDSTFGKPINLNVGRFNPYSGIGDVNGKLNTVHDLYSNTGAQSIYGGSGQAMSAQINDSTKKFETSYQVDVNVTIGEAVGKASEDLKTEIANAVTQSVTTTMEKRIETLNRDVDDIYNNLYRGTRS